MFEELVNNSQKFRTETAKVYWRINAEAQDSWSIAASARARLM